MSCILGGESSTNYSMKPKLLIIPSFGKPSSEGQVDLKDNFSNKLIKNC